MLTGEDARPLIYPRRLLANQREVAARYLRVLAPGERQAILDELEGRFRAERKGMKPLYDALSFLQALCKAARSGTFQPNLGLNVLARRREREPSPGHASQADAQAPLSESAQQRTQRKAVARERIAKIRHTLGSNTCTKKHDVTDES